MAGYGVRVAQAPLSPAMGENGGDRHTAGFGQGKQAHFPERRTLLPAAQALLAQGTGNAGPMAVCAIFSIGLGEGHSRSHRGQLSALTLGLFGWAEHTFLHFMNM